MSSPQNAHLTSSSQFSLIVTGHIESAMFPEHDSLYCKYSFVHGPDWTIMTGLEDGLTQIAKKPRVSTFNQSVYSTGNFARTCVWNFPVDVTFKSTNLYGWPQMIIAVYGLDEFGRDVIRGYGSIRLPLQSGRHTLYVPTFVPIASSPLNGLLSWLTGRLPEFLDSKFVSYNKGREVTRVKSQGTVKLQLAIATKGTDSYGIKLGSTASIGASYDSIF